MAYNKKQKLSENISALKILVKLKNENRQATEDERSLLRRYSGFGGLKFILNPCASEGDIVHWVKSEQPLFEMTQELYAVIKELADNADEERELISSVKRSVNTAFYTPNAVIDALAKSLKDAGIEIHSLLDPSAGIGKFGDAFKAAYPDGMKVEAFEKDILTGRILSALNPKDDITINGFETIAKQKMGSFDVATSNIPFGEFKVFDAEFKNSKDPGRRNATGAIHNYFFLKALDSVRDGGLVAFITSTGVMDSGSNAIFRQEMMKHANLVSAVRLPNGLFNDDAGTEVASDLIILQKDMSKNMSVLSDRDSSFVQDVVTNEGISLNSVFVANFNQIDNKRILADEIAVGKNAYGSEAYEYYFDGDNEQLYERLSSMISADIKENLDLPLYKENLIEKQAEVKPVQVETIQQPRNETKPKTKKEQVQSAPVQLDLFAMWDADVDVNADQPAKVTFTLDPRSYNGELKSYYRDGIYIIDQESNQLGFLSDYNKTFNPSPLPEDKKAVLRQYVLVRDTYELLYSTEAEERIEHPELREELNRVYDDFVKRFGHLNDRKNAFVINMDVKGSDCLTLENGDGMNITKADIFSRPVSFIANELEHVDTPEEGLFASLNQYGSVDLDYISQLTGNSVEELPELLKGKIYYMPDGTYETSTKLLSGNVYNKLAYVEDAYNDAKERGDDPKIVSALEESKDALTQVIPQQIAYDDIGLQFGERWIPTKYYEGYISKLFDTEVSIKYAEHIDEYTIEAKSRYTKAITEEFCVRGEYRAYDGIALLLHAFHDTTPDIQKCVGYDSFKDEEIKGPDNDKIRLASDKIQEIRDGFAEYLTNLPKEDRDVLQEHYNRKFNCFVKAKYDGSHQTFPGIDMKALGNPRFNIKNIYKSQKDCVWMLVQNGGGICDHEVGTGKTLIMCTAAHEMHRLGLANKPLIIALKANVAEIAATYQAAFPDDKILYASEKDFSPKNRAQFFNRIKNNDYACVVMSHDQFGKIPQSLEIQKQILSDEIRDMDEALEVLRKQGANISKRILTGLEKRKENLEARVKEMQDEMNSRTDDVVDFGTMGIDHIFIDESHQFKNLMFTTRHQRVSGLGSPAGSQKALNLLYAIRTIQNRTGKDLGATFLSGTTISNSLTELYLLFKYLRPNAMAEQGIHSFDAWAAVYAKKTRDYEFNVTNQVATKERFRYFLKVPELAMFYNEVTDYRTGDDVGLDRPNMNVILHSLKPTPDQAEFNQRLIEFAKTGDGELIYREPLDEREMKGKMLIATDASRKASLDMRLVNPDLFGDDPGNKASQCARIVADYYNRFNEHKGTQFIFSDLSTYKPGEWNIFSEIKDKLVNEYGIPADEVRFIQEAKNEKQRKAIIEAMNEGTIRVLFGSTSTLGTGVNAQKRAVAVHHIDIPWRPSDLEQRNGRARRAGNIVAKNFANNMVDIHIYAVERSLDVYKFNLLQNKDLFIKQIKTNSLGTRVIDEGAFDEENGMSFAEMVAILSDNDDLLKKAKLEKRILGLESERKTYMQARRETEYRLEDARSNYNSNIKIIDNLKDDLNKFKAAAQYAEDGTVLPGLVIDGINEYASDGSYNVEGMGAALQEAGRTIGNKDRIIGNVYGFSLIVNTIYAWDDRLHKEVYAGNEFTVKGNYTYDYNHRKLAMSKDNRLGAVRYGVQALEKIPSYIEQYEKRNTNLAADIKEYERIAGKPWGKEEELKNLKAEMAELEKKIQASLDETNESVPKEDVKPYTFSREGRSHSVTFDRAAFSLVDMSEMEEFASDDNYSNRGYVSRGRWENDHKVDDGTVECYAGNRKKVEEFINKVVELQNQRQEDIEWLLLKAKENINGDMTEESAEVIESARHILDEKGVEWTDAPVRDVSDIPAKEYDYTPSEVFRNTRDTDKALALSIENAESRKEVAAREANLLNEYAFGDDYKDHRNRKMFAVGSRFGLLPTLLEEASFQLLGYDRFTIQGAVSKSVMPNPWDDLYNILKWAIDNKGLDAKYLNRVSNLDFNAQPDENGLYPKRMSDDEWNEVVYKYTHNESRVFTSAELRDIASYLPDALKMDLFHDLVNISRIGAVQDMTTHILVMKEGDLANMFLKEADRYIKEQGSLSSDVVRDSVSRALHQVYYIDNNEEKPMTIYSCGQYGGDSFGEERRQFAHELKENRTGNLYSIVREMSSLFYTMPPEDKKRMLLVPMPSANGYPGYTEKLAEALSVRTNIPCASILYSVPHESFYDLKASGVKHDELPKVRFEVEGHIDKDTIVVLVDNVLDTGRTMSLAANADFGGAEVRGLVLAHTDNYKESHPDMTVKDFDILSNEKEERVKAEKARKEAGFAAALEAVSLRFDGNTENEDFAEVKSLLNQAWFISFMKESAQRKLSEMGIDWITGKDIEKNDSVSMQVVPDFCKEVVGRLKQAPSSLSDSEKYLVAKIAQDIADKDRGKNLSYELSEKYGNNAIDENSDDYKKMFEEVQGVLRGLHLLTINDRQRDILNEMRDFYIDGLRDIAKQADVDINVVYAAIGRNLGVKANSVSPNNGILVDPMRDKLIEHMRTMGINVSTDWQIAEDILEKSRTYFSNIPVGITVADIEDDPYYKKVKLSKAIDSIVESESSLKYFRNGDSQAYGFVHLGTIYIDPRIATAETPIHEYTHLWAEVLRQKNPEEWQNIVKMMKDTPEVWNYVRRQYPDLYTDDDIADEALAQFSGRHGYDRLIDMSEDAKDKSFIEKMLDILKEFWSGITDFFGIHYTDKEQVADRILYDLLHGTNPLAYGVAGTEIRNHMAPADREIGNAVVEQLQKMGIEVSDDHQVNRRVLKAAQKDQSEAGKVRHMKTEEGVSYGFVYKDKMYLDKRYINGELPLHEYAHLWCEALRRINPENWNSVVATMKQDADTWKFVKDSYPELTDESDLAEEVIAHYSGKRGAEKLQKEMERMQSRDANYSSRWGNIYQNVAKAVQDFWKHIGDSVNTQYSSKEDIADQILNDFAKQINPVKKMERWLEERDKEYADAVENKDFGKAGEIFNAALQENVGNGITPFVAVDGYRGKMDRLARAVKKGKPEDMREAASLMAKLVPDNAVLVPAPSHGGLSSYTRWLANYIKMFKNDQVEVADVLRCYEHESQYEHKKATGKALTPDELRIYKDGELPEGKLPVVIDNVVNTGNTAEACIKALGKGIVLSLASAVSQERHVASLKSANPIVYDKEGKLIPLSERFEIKNKYLGRLMNYRPIDKIQGLESYDVEDIELMVEDFVNEKINEVYPERDIYVKEVSIIGSRSRGEAHDGSDLDILLEYGGKDVREDDLFNVLHEEPFVIEGIVVDINPINPHYSRNTAEWLERDAQWRAEDKAKLTTEKEVKPILELPVNVKLVGLLSEIVPNEGDKAQFIDVTSDNSENAEYVTVSQENGEFNVTMEDGNILSLTQNNDEKVSYSLEKVYKSALSYRMAKMVGDGNTVILRDYLKGYRPLDFNITVAVGAVKVENNMLKVGFALDNDEIRYINADLRVSTLEMINEAVSKKRGYKGNIVLEQVRNYQKELISDAIAGEKDNLYADYQLLSQIVPDKTKDIKEWFPVPAEDKLRIYDSSFDFTTAISTLPQNKVNAIREGVKAMFNAYSQEEVVKFYYNTINYYANKDVEKGISDNIVQLLGCTESLDVYKWIRETPERGWREPIEALKAMLSTKDLGQIKDIMLSIQERNLEVDHKDYKYRNELEKAYVPVVQNFISKMSVSGLTTDERAIYKKLDYARNADELKSWASDILTGSALTKLSENTLSMAEPIKELATKISATDNESLNNELVSGFAHISALNDIRTSSLASQLESITKTYPEETILFRSGKGMLSAYGSHAEKISAMTGWTCVSVPEYHTSWINITHDGFNYLTGKDLSLRVVTPNVNILPLANLWKDDMTPALQRIDYNLSFAPNNPIVINGSLAIDDFKVKALDFHETGLTAIGEDGKELVVRDLPTNFYHAQGTIVVADYLNGHRRTVERLYESEQIITPETKKEQTMLYNSFKEIKNKYPNEVVLFRQKGFMESFGDDAVKLANSLRLPLYQRNIEDNDNGKVYETEFVMISDETFAEAMEKELDMDVHIVSKPAYSETRLSIHNSLVFNSELPAIAGEQPSKLVAEITTSKEGRCTICLIEPEINTLKTDMIELSPDESKEYLEMSGSEDIERRSDFVLSMADKYFAQEKQLMVKSEAIIKNYESLGLSDTPIALPREYKYQREDGVVENFNAYSINTPDIVLYQSMDDAENTLSPTFLRDLPVNMQLDILESMKVEAMKNESLDNQNGLSNESVDSSMKRVSELVNSLGLEYVPVTLRVPVPVEPGMYDDWREDTKIYAFASYCAGDVVVYENRTDAYDDLNGISISEIPADKQKEVLHLMEERLVDKEAQMTVFVDSPSVPTWALSAIVNGDFTGLNDEEEKMVKDFCEKYPNHILSPRDESPYFTDNTAFGLATDCVKLDIVRTATPKELLEEKQKKNNVTQESVKVEEVKTETTKATTTSAKDYWKNLDYTKYTIPEGVTISNARVRREPPMDGEKYPKYYIECDALGNHYSKVMYSNDITAYYEKDEFKRRTNRVTLDQLVAKYFGKQFANSMSIGSVQEAEQVFAEQKDNKESQIQEQKDAEARAAAAEKAEKEKKAEEEKKQEKKEKVPSVVLQASLLIGAMVAAREKDGIWLNPDCKVSPTLKQSDNNISAFNALMMGLYSDANGYKTNSFTTFNDARQNGFSVKSGESSLPFNWYNWDKYINKFNSNDIISKDEYNKLDPEEKDLYKQMRSKEERGIFNIDQTTMSEVKGEDYKKIVETKPALSVAANNSADVLSPYQYVQHQKEKRPDAIFLVRGKDSYEVFGEDAEKLGKLLSLPCEKCEERGFEFEHSSFEAEKLDRYLPIVIRNGYRVAICDQPVGMNNSEADKIYNVTDKLATSLIGQDNDIVVGNLNETKFDSKDNKLYICNSHVSAVGEEKADAIAHVNDFYRACVAYTGTEDKLSRSGFPKMLPADSQRYEHLIQELAAGVMMAREGMPARLSKEGLADAKYWERELKECPIIINSIERDVNNAVQVLEKIGQGETVDYASMRGDKAFETLRPRSYTISSQLSKYPSEESKEVVVIKDDKHKTAAVILPAGASLEVNNEVPGMNKNRFVIALRKQGYEDVKFYNAGGQLSMVMPNDFFIDKKVVVSKLKQYELEVHENVDLTKEIARTSKAEIKQVLMTADDEGKYLIYVKPAESDAFVVYPEKLDVDRFYSSLNTPKFNDVRMDLGQKYLSLVAKHPELKLDILMPPVENVDLSRISNVNITSDKYKVGDKILFATIDGERQKPITLTNVQVQRFWLADDKEMYKTALAAQLFKEKLSLSPGHLEDDQVRFRDDNEGQNVSGNEMSPESSEEVHKADPPKFALGR